MVWAAPSKAMGEGMHRNLVHSEIHYVQDYYQALTSKIICPVVFWTELVHPTFFPISPF